MREGVNTCSCYIGGYRFRVEVVWDLIESYEFVVAYLPRLIYCTNWESLIFYANNNKS